MYKTITLLLAVVSVLALFCPKPLTDIHPLSKELDSLIMIQGNSLLQRNELPRTVNPASYAVVLGKNPNCPVLMQCKSYVESRGVVLPDGNANMLKSNIDYPIVGGAVLFWGGRYGHVAYIEGIDNVNNKIFISEQNWQGCGIVSSRWVSLDNSSIKGFVY